ncbi:OmpA family protein [Pseudoxanthomonas sp. LjRoot143]|uniref:DUF7507 domain-containing protein n=1 Tax=Pseudoxanthomonas sp. LjRoot143 TaxID=3342266 RepID=UPI003ECD15AD
MQIAAALQGRQVGTTDRRKGRSGVFAAFALMALLALFVPTVHAQIKNGGFEAQNFSEWKLERYTRSSSALPTVPPTNSSQLTLGTVQETIASNNTVNTAFGGNVRILTTPGTAANTGTNGVRYPFSGTASSQLGGNGARAGYAMEQEATMVLSDVDPVDGKVHLRFAMAPVLNNPNHAAGQQPFFFVEVINLTKGNTQLFHTFNYSNQSGIPWQSFGAYQFTNWQGFDISPGNGRLDVGDQIRLKVYVANCSAGAADHTAQVYMDVFGSKMPGLSVAAIGPSTTKPGEQITYNYNYVNNSGVYALGSTVRLAAPFTENGLPLTFVPGSWPATCTGPHAGTPPRGSYIDCPVGDLVAGAGGSFPVTFTVPAGAATTGPNNVINNGDYDVRANTVSPFIGPLVKTTISPAATTLVDLGVSVSNGGVPSYLVGGAVTYTVTVTNNGPVAATGATVSQTLSGANGTASWTCAVPGGSTASCGATSSGSGPISTATANLPVGQSLVYTVSGITAGTAGTPVVTVVSVTPPAGMSDSVAANNTDGVSTPVTAAQHRLTANTIGAGSGRISAVPAAFACPSGGARTACSTDNLGENQEAYLNAIADNGSIFKGWTGGCTTITGNECYVRMGTQDLNVTAEFAQVWIVTPSITGGTLNSTSPQVVEDGQGTSFTLTPTTPGHIPVITTPGGANTCQATLSGPTAGVYTYNVTPVTQDCAFHVAFVSQPRLVIAKTASIVAPDSAVVGVPFDYTITVTNTGAAATSATATVTDVVPTGLTIGTLPANCATNPSGSQTVECTIAAGLSNVAPGNAVSFVIPVTPQGGINNTTVSNTASVTGGGDPACATAGSCVSAPVDTPVVAPSLDIAKSGPATAVVGVAYDYTITVTNTGTAATSATATVTDVVPAGLTIGTLPADCVLNPAGSQTVVCTIAVGLSNAPGNSVSYVIPVTPTAAAGTAVSNTATVVGGGDPDCATGCSSPAVDTTINAPKLEITKSGPATAITGVPFDYTIGVSNTGTADATADAVVTDSVPVGMTVNSATPNCAIAGRDVTCTVAMADLTVGGAVTITINVTPIAAGGAANTATVTGGGDPDCVAGCDSTPVTTTVDAQAPSLTVVKSVTSTGPYGVGSVIAYQFAVTNSGNVTLTGVVVNDALLDTAATCAATTLAPGASTTCTGVHTVTAAEVAAGNVHNSATVTGQPPTPPGGPTPPTVTSPPSTVDTATEQLPAITVVKSVTSTGPYGVGSVIAYQFAVTNSGNVTLSNIVVNDALLDTAATCAATTLAPGASTTCTGVHTVTAAEVAAGNVHNSATVTGQPPTPPGGPTPPTVTSPPSTVDTATEQLPAITVVKSVTSTGPYGVGSVIAYQFAVTNSGNVTLTNVVVNDALLDTAATCAATTLAPGASTTCTGVHTVTAAEVASGNVHNSATVTGQPPTPPGGPTPPTVTSPPSTVDTATAQNPALSLIKSVTSTGPYGVGSVIAYQFAVTNTGDVTLTGVVVNDAQLDAAAICPVTTLAPGASTTCTGVHTVTAAEVAAGNVHNSATVTGQPPTPPGGPTPPTVTSPPSTVDTATAQAPAMTVVKSVTSTGPYGVGSVIAYQFVVTNTGDVTLSNIVVNDALLDTAATCAATTLAPGASTTCTGVHTVTAAEVAAGNVHNSATVTGQPPTPPGGTPPTPITSPPSTVDTATEQLPAISVVKSVTSTGPYGVGSVIAYQFAVTNSGNVTLSNVVVNDALLDTAATCAATTLAPGANTTCTGVHTVTAAEVAAGNVHNSATVTGQPPTPPGGPTPPTVTSPPSTVDTATEQLPAMTVVKSVTSTGPYGVGSVIAYQFAVTNSGNVTLSNVVVNDALLDTAATCAATTLAPGASTTCTGVHTVTAAEVAAGNVHNSATVTGQPPTPPGGPTPPTVTSPPSTVDTATAQNPALSLIKSVTSTGPYGVGSVIAYQFAVTNTGDVTLTGVIVNDAQLDAAAICLATTLAPGASTTCTGVHTVTAAEVAAGNVHNSATVTGQPPTPPGGPTPPTVTSPPSTVDTATEQLPAMTVVKSVTSTGPYGVGSVIAYQFAVTNSGNVTLTNVVVNDALLDTAATCAATTLAPGASTTCTGVHTVTAAEVASGNVHNSATVTGQPPTPPGGPTPPTVTSPPSTVDTATEQLPAMTVVKSVTSTGPYGVGSVIAYQFAVTNSGNVTLTNVVVNDALLDTAATCAATTLAPGASTTCTGVHTVTAAEVAAGNVHNSATVTGQPPTPPGGPTPPTVTSPPSTVDTATEQLPAITLVKSVTSTGPYRAGSTIAYQFEVENTGNVTLTDVSVVDALAGLGPLTYAWPAAAGQLLPGERVVANANYSVTPADVLAGNVRNSATVTGRPPTPPGGTSPPDVSSPPSTVDTSILPVIDAVDDLLASVNGATGVPSAGNAYDNDVINGVAVDPAAITGTVTTPATSINGGPVPTLDPASGVVTVPAGTPAGTYTIGYRICETLNPDNCDDAVVSLTVVAATINAEDDAFVPIRSGGGGTSPSVLGNDTLGGGPAQIGQVTLVPGGSPHAGLVMNPDGTVTIAAGTPPGTYRYPYTLCEVLNPTNCDTADAIVVVSGEALLRVTKTAGVRDVQTGDLVRYTVTVENLGDGPLVGGSIVDTPAAGLSYVEGSLLVSDGDNAATVSGQHPVRFEGLDIPVGGTARLVYMMRVGAGARAGTLVNQAQAVSSSGEPLSNVATAEVALVADAMVEDSLVFGTVFNDRDGDGWQDGAALSGVRVQGGFAPEVYVAGSTTLDRGTGPQPQADASAPLLHGIEVGAMAGRQSEADPVQGRQVVIRQTLRELSFADDFVLTSDQGVTLRMDRNGVTSLETSGEAAKGLTAAMPTVERRVAQGEGGYVVDYVIGNAGIEERGVPGVRIATVEGLLIETDQFGRYHLAGVSGGAWERGRNVVLKVDPSTLPAGTRMTTDNPLLRRVTPGVPVRFDWGVVLPEQVIEGGSEQLELELGEVHFAPGSAALPPRYQPLITAMAAKVREHQGGEVVIQADGEGEGLALDRANAVRDALLSQLDAAATQSLVVSIRARSEEPASLVAGVRDDATVLGTVLFDTDKATLRAEFAPLLDAMAAALERKGGGNVVIVGHADRRGSHAYNTALGMQRAKAVFDALAARLGASARATLRVEIENDPVAPNGARK